MSASNHFKDCICDIKFLWQRKWFNCRMCVCAGVCMCVYMCANSAKHGLECYFIYFIFPCSSLPQVHLQNHTLDQLPLLRLVNLQLHNFSPCLGPACVSHNTGWLAFPPVVLCHPRLCMPPKLLSFLSEWLQNNECMGRFPASSFGSWLLPSQEVQLWMEGSVVLIKLTRRSTLF